MLQYNSLTKTRLWTTITINAWWLFEFPIHHQHPPVVCLQIHLPSQHMVSFNPNDTVQQIMHCAEQERTMLTAFFAANWQYPEARNYTYQEFPQHFVWNNTKKVWMPWKQAQSAIGWMHFITPTAGDCFYLHLLLITVKGAMCWQDLLTVGNTIHPTFYAACLERGHPSRPHLLWDEFRNNLCEDLSRRLLRSGFHDISHDDIFNYGLFYISCILLDYGYLLHNFPSMPLPKKQWQTLNENTFIAEQLTYNTSKESELALCNCMMDRDSFCMVQEVLGRPLFTKHSVIIFEHNRA